jgi:hypothetical protein
VTPDDVRARVEEIRSVADDDESAHGKEDRLHADVLRAIASGNPHAQALALEALATEDIGFARWCA